MKKILLTTSLITIMAATSALAAGQHKGSIEGGLTLARGNTDNDNLNGKVGVASTYGKVENEFTATAYGAKSSGVRSGENYNANDKLKYNFDELNYGFGEGDWSNNRFAGYSERLSGLVGAGHHFMKEPNLNLYGEVGGGYRTTDYIPIAQKDESSAVGKIGGGLNWKINEYVQFGQTVNSVIGKDNTVTTSDTSVKSFLNRNLYLKFGYNFQNQSEVPAGVKNNDSLTTFSVGYDF